MELAQKTCLITGGTRGIGAATAILLARSGADVAIVGRRDDEEARQTRRAVEQTGRRCLFIQADVAVPAAAMDCVARTIRELGSVDALVHSAGGPVPGRLMEITPEMWYGAFDIHVHPIFHMCRAVVPHMKQKKEGAIILISSTAGIRALRTNIAYQAVKGAIPQITRALAFELADDNIRVNCVAPGVVRTAFHATMAPETRQHNLEHRIPLHREGTPEQVATVIREMITNDYITGETYVVDGGLTMRIC